MSNPARVEPAAGSGEPNSAGSSEPGGGRTRSSHRSWWRRSLLRDELGVLIVLVVIVAVVGIVHPAFMNQGNLLSTVQSSTYVGLMACGMVFPLAMRDVDLSVGGNFALGIVVGADLIHHGWNPWLAAFATVILCGLLGAVNGIIATTIQAPTFIVTLATALLFRGFALALANGKQITDLPPNSTLFTVLGDDVAGAPTADWVLLGVVIVLTVVFTRTRFGAQLRAVGSNPDAAVFSGLPVGRIRAQAMAVSGALSGLAAVLALSFFIAGDPTIGQGYELSAIAACIIGGTPLMGGKGSVVGAAMGSLILTVVASSLAFFHVPVNWTTFATGAVILAAVALDAQLRRTRGRGLINRRLGPTDRTTTTSTEAPSPSSTQEN